LQLHPSGQFEGADAVVVELEAAILVYVLFLAYYLKYEEMK
jgi:hypothetical protein